MALGARVKELRRKLGWKQVTLAKNSGIPQATISRIESGRVTQPRMGQLQKLAKALGTTIDYQVGDSIEMSFDDSRLGWEQAQVVFRYWGKLSQRQREELANFARYLSQDNQCMEVKDG